ncbi:MAG: winged helix DNA-binding domain-containing protein [Chloroflexota bacterium]|nr:winged helix DNA-binding domain-containing protein [Chloroflexota bacterium]
MQTLNIPHLRLHQQLITRPFAQPEDVVRWMGAMQAQDYHQAVWAIGVRTQSGTLAQVEQAIADARIIRTWPMRGTIHFIPPQDARWMLQLTAARMVAKDTRRLHQLELTGADIERCKGIVHDALAGGKRLTRSALLQTLDDAGISTAAQRGYHILWNIAQQGLICIGPMQDKEQTFALLDEWAGEQRDLTGDEALAELATRYFTSHGPATLHDFAWWAGLTQKEVKIGVAVAGDRLRSELHDSKAYYMAADAEPAPAASGMVLLPGYDEYLLGYQVRDAVLSQQHAQKVCPGNNGVFYPMIVQDGQIIGTWKREIKKQTVTITPSPFEGAIDSAAFASAASGYGSFYAFAASISM